MDRTIKKGKLYHLIKYRNRVNPSSCHLSDEFERFDVNGKRRRRIFGYMQKIITRKTQIKRLNHKVTPLELKLRENGVERDIEEFCRNCSTTSISRSIEKAILERVTVRDFKGDYKILLKDIIMENRQEFLQITHQSGIEMKLRSIERKFLLKPYKYLGRTENYQMFIQKRKELKCKYLLYHPLIKQILNECVANLPYELFNLKQWLKSPMEFDEFQDHLQDLANDAAQYLQEFYRRIVTIVENTNISCGQRNANYLGACTGLLSVNMSRTIAHTLLHVVNFTGSKEHTPYLKLNITFNDRLILEPTADDIVDIYDRFLRRIITSARQFYVLERYKFHTMNGVTNKNIYLCLTDEFLESCLKKIYENVQLKYKSIVEYLGDLERDFSPIYDDVSFKSDDVLTTDLIFDEGCKKILYYKSYLTKVAYIPDNVYFDIGQLSLLLYRTTLERSLQTIVSNIFGKLSAQHEWENNDICEAFDIIYVKATQKPITTEEVIEIGKYMVWVKDEYLNELKERVIKALEYLTKLIQLGLLTEDHMLINAQAINWLDKIVPVLEENNIVYEQLKFEAEERLQRVIEETNVVIKNVYPLLTILDSMDDITKVKDYLNIIVLHMVKIKEIEEQIEWINKEEVCLSFPKSIYAEFEDLKNYVYPFHHLLKLCLDVQRNLSVWLDGQFDLIIYEKTRDKVKIFREELIAIQKVYRSKLRQAQDENLSVRFRGTVDDPDMLNWPAPLKLCSKAINLIQDFEPSLTVIKIMCNEALMKRHWIEMSKVAGFDIKPNAGTTLKKIIKIDLNENIDQYEIISVAASKEKELLENLNQMQYDWNPVNFHFERQRDIEIFVQLDDIRNIFDDHMIKITNMRSSIFVKPYRDRVENFYDLLIRINNTLEEGERAQSELLRLLPLFSSEQITLKIFQETELFLEVRAIFGSYIEHCRADSNVKNIVSGTDILKDFIKCNRLLETINLGISNYLNSVRQYFPRFYFLTNNELVAVLSAQSEPRTIQNNIKKTFNAIEAIEFNDNLEITGIIGGKNEIISLNKFVDTNSGGVEEWQKLLGIGLNESVRELIHKAEQNYHETHLVNWLTKWPSQVLLTVSQINFTSNGHRALSDGTLSVYLSQLETNLENIVEFIRKCNRTNASKANMISYTVITLNNIQTMQTLINNKVERPENFHWLALLRYYIQGSECIIEVLNTIIIYGLEYLGTIDQIIITPATERCYHTLITAYHDHLHGIYEGITDTRQTETIKSLAQALGLYYVIFTCSPLINFQVILKYLKGTLTSGAWLILNEFSTIPKIITSQVSQEIYKISMAMKSGLNKIVVDDEALELKKCFICLTMATSKELPENFKALFRTVTTTLPDNKIIAEIALFSHGFRHSRTLSSKIILSLDLISNLSSIKNVKCGTRTIRDIVDICGELFTSDLNNEEIILGRALKFLYTSHLTKDDLDLFNQIMEDLFSGSDQHYIEEDLLLNDIKSTCETMKLQPTKEFCTKIIQLHNTMLHRTGNIIIGKTLTGKSTLINVLHATMQLKGAKINVEIINPKTVTLEQLYGKYDTKSMVWMDGIISRAIRTIDTEMKWIIFDGPMESVWLDNLNNVLDRQGLSLCSGEILPINVNTSLIFEVDNLKDASPITMSHAGIIHMNNSITGWQSIISSWIYNNNFEWRKGHEETIIALFDWIVPPSLEFIKTNCQQVCKINDVSLVKTMMLLVEMLLNDAYDVNMKKEDDFKNLTTWIQASFLQAGIWGLGSTLDTCSRIKFDEFYKQLWKNQNKTNQLPKCIEKIEVSIPMDGLIFDYNYVYKLKGNWKFWADTLKNEKMEESVYSSYIYVPTVDSIKYSSIINMHITHNQPLLLTGSEGAGKTLWLHNILINKLDRARYYPSVINFTPNTSAERTQELILSKLNRTKLCHYYPPESKVAIYFIDDLNVVGNDSPIELLRQYHCYKNWWSNTNLINLHNINIVGAMGLCGGQNRKLCQRFLRHFNVFVVNQPCEDSTLRIYSNILLHKWKKIGFSNDILATVNQIVSATYNIYQEILASLKPTLYQNLYRFNLRNFSRVIQACCMIKKESTDVNKKLYYKLWTHEILRIFGDRLLEKDKNFLYQNINYCFETYFKEELGALFDKLPIAEGELAGDEFFTQIVFGTYLNNDLSYFEETNIEQLCGIAENVIKDYNELHENKLDLVLFDYAVQHLSKICRVLAMPCTNLLQIGICGSGRETLVKLACIIYKQELFKVEFSGTYQKHNWRNDLYRCLKQAGGYGKSSVLLLREEYINNDYFGDIDWLLKCHNVSDFFLSDEREEILELARTSAQGGNKNLDIDPNLVFMHYSKKCKENLHIILCFSPINQKLRKYLQVYSSITNYCEIDLFNNWPKEALEAIANKWTEELNINETIKPNIVDSFIFIHNSMMGMIGENYATSGPFLEFVKLYFQLSKYLQEQITFIKERYLSALEKLSFAALQISEMQKSLAEYQPQLEAMTVKAYEMTKQIEKETVEVEKASNLVKQDEKIANEQAAAAQILKLDCEADLAQAIPILEDAISALNTLKPTDITLVKSMKNPPDAIKLVMAAVCVIKDVKPDRIPDPSTGRKTLDYWGPSKRILGDMNFLQTLKDFDKDHIKPEVMAKIRKEYLPHKDFRPQIVAKASSAAEGLCKWIIAMDMYDKVAKEVAPKKEKLEKAEREYATTMEILSEKKEQVARIEQKLADLNALLDEANRKQQKLQRNVDLCKKKLGRAQRLIGGLSEEKIRWSCTADQLEQLYNALPGDVILSSGIIAYLGPLAKQTRQKLIQHWLQHINSLQIPFTQQYVFHQMFTRDIDFEYYIAHGLPIDEYFKDNVIIKQFSTRPCLFIDPQNQATNWICSIEKANNLKITKFPFGNYLDTIMECIKCGYPTLVQCISQIDISLTTMIKRVYNLKNQLVYVEFMGTLLPANKNFKLYLTTNHKKPVFPSEIYDRLTIIDFNLTTESLQQFFLTTIIEIEQPSLRKLKKHLTSQQALNRKTLNDIEEKILKMLSESKVDILEDEKALQILDESKILSKTIYDNKEQLLISSNTLNEYRINYKIVSTFVAMLYLCIFQLSKLNHMYQFSFEWFMNLYADTVQEKAPKFRNLDQRRISIINTLLYETYSKLISSIFQKDQLFVPFFITLNMLLIDNKISIDEIRFLSRNGHADSTINVKENPNPDCLPDENWRQILDLARLESYEKFPEFFTTNLDLFKGIMGDEFDKIYDLPEPYNKRFTPLLLSKVIRRDKFYYTVQNFIKNELNEKFMKPLPFDVSVSFTQSHVLTPIIFILTPGFDLITPLLSFAKKRHFEKKLHFCFAHKDNTKTIVDLIENARINGLWICIENCHLSTDWLPYLEIILENLNYDNTHENFKMLLTTNETSEFPISLLEKCIKIIAQVPAGLKRKLHFSFTRPPINCEQFYDSCPGKQEIFMRLLYATALFHSFIQERQCFGRYGWHIPYKFSQHDFNITIKQLNEIINKYENPFEQIVYLLAKCNYGGQIRDKWDQRLVEIISQDYINSNINQANFLFNDCGPYGLPSKSDLQDYINYIENLPDIDDITVFGLHENYKTVRDAYNSNTILEPINLIFNQIEQAEHHLNLNQTVNCLLGQLPQPFDTNLTRIVYLNDKIIIDIIVKNEITKYRKLLKIIELSLHELEAALKGSASLTHDLEQVAKCLSSNKVPQLWTKFSFKNCYNLSDFMQNLNKRVEFFKQFSVEPPQNIYIGYFYNPKSFFTAIKLHYSNKIPALIKEINFQFRVVKNSNQCQVDNEVLISGLILIGAKWDNKENCLQELLPNILEYPMGSVIIQPIIDVDVKRLYECPIFQILNQNDDPERSNYINSIFLHTKISPIYWIKRGVTLYCQ